MIFVYPVFHALQHKLAHERFLRSSLVTAAGTVRILSILGLAIVIIRIGTLEIAAVDIESMVIYGIENHSDACLMQRHHHLLELLDSGCWRIRVGSVTAFRHIIVLRIIPPVELWFVESGLIYRSEIEYRLEVDGVDAQILEIFDGLRLGEGEIFTLIFQAGCRRNGEITHVKLVDNEIGWRFQGRTHVLIPSRWISIIQIYNGATVSVHTYCFGKCTWCFTLANIKGIELSLEVALYCSLPALITQLLHFQRFISLSSLTLLIKTEGYRRLLGCWSIQDKHGFLLGIHHLIECLLRIQ